MANYIYNYVGSTDKGYVVYLKHNIKYTIKHIQDDIISMEKQKLNYKHSQTLDIILSQYSNYSDSEM